MSDNSSDDDEIVPVFAFRADYIMKKQREAYEEMLKKVEEGKVEDTTKTVEDEENDLLEKIRERLKRKPTAKRKANAKPPSKKIEEKVPPSRRSKRQRKTEEVKEDKIPEKKEESPIKLPARAKKRLMKLDLQNKRERKKIEELNRRVLSSCFSSSVDDNNTSIEIETEQNITLKICYLSEISKITVNENEKFSSIISKVANLFKLNVTEIALYLRDEIINMDASPHSLNVKTWDIIECTPYKSTSETQDEENADKILIKLQSNDCKKKIEIYAHKLEKFQNIMEQYANLRKLPLKDLIFEFDGERIGNSDTPEELDMETGSCVDVKVIGDSLKPAPPSVPIIDLEREEEIPHTMLDICVLD